MTNSEGKLKGLHLLQAVKGELFDVLDGQGVSDMDLYLAAQQLIDLSKKEYIEPNYNDQAQRAGYYSHAVDTAITKMQSSLWRNETIGWDDGEDLIRPSDKAAEMQITHRKHLIVGRFDGQI